MNDKDYFGYIDYDLRSENCSSDKIRVESIQLVNYRCRNGSCTIQIDLVEFLNITYAYG